jgi:predicted nicotinamide N-methyase
MAGYLTHERETHVPGVAGLMLRSLQDSRQFDDPAGAAQALGIGSALWPLFGLVWPSSVQLAAQLARQPVLAGQRILEIGCGLGLASLVGHRLGANVTASDCHPLAGGFLAANLLLNTLGPMNYRHGHWGASAEQRRQARSQGLAILRGRYDHVVGSDLLYERDESGTLARFIDHHTLPSALVWIVDPDRSNRSAFTRHMAAFGFSVDEERLDRPASAHAPAYRGRLLSYRRNCMRSS